MKVINYKDIEPTNVEMDGVKNATVRKLIYEADAAPTFAMRFFELSDSGNTPFHSHPWEHEVFIVEGSGLLKLKDNTEKTLNVGDAVFIEPNEQHQFVAQGTMKFICMVPVNTY